MAEGGKTSVVVSSVDMIVLVELGDFPETDGLIVYFASGDFDVCGSSATEPS